MSSHHPAPSGLAHAARAVLRGAVAAIGLLALPGTASAQETVDIGVIRHDDVTVVQKLLYPKTRRTELGVHLGVMPFDVYLTTPTLQVSFGRHLSERLAWNLVGGGGYGLETAVYNKLESPTYGVAVYAFRYLGSLLGGVEWSPIYAKMNVNGARVVHFDVYGTGRAGVTFEQSVLPDASLVVAPTLSLGLGTRMFTGKNTALHVAFRDDVMIQRRSITSSTAVKQNALVSVGLAFLSKVKGG